MTLLIDALPVVAPADTVPGPPQGRWTHADLATLPDDSRHYEILQGVLYMRSAPNIAHQAADRWFVFYLTMHVQVTGLGQVFGPPCDVELSPHDVVQPDVIVVLNAHAEIITVSHIVGTPDLVVEIASPSTAGYDRRGKQDTYARAGVPEYWVADLAARTVEVLILHEGAYRSLGAFQGGATLPSQVALGLPVRVEQFFA